MHAFPLRLPEQVIGALNVFGTAESGELADLDAPIIQALADVATIGSYRSVRSAAPSTSPSDRGAHSTAAS
ncbi:hypothetical protein AB0M36_25035 [Actinoplanes sp. NPDC051346]|uniref:hypothetical protein n=1 Tax=Actinoplanes sp. NPDC051346 TaxID=3155048 RepID=UPI003416C051